MFIDYYQILEISFPSSQEEIKKSYRLLSLKWHPDKNPGVDTTKKMQNINAAYFLLKDPVKKQRYDIEYQLFQDSTKNIRVQETANPHSKGEWTRYNKNTTYKEQQNYNFSNKKVQEDIDEATLFAKNLVEEFLKQLRLSSKDAAKGAWNEMSPFIVVAIILPIIFALIRSCQ